MGLLDEARKRLKKQKQDKGEENEDIEIPNKYSPPEVIDKTFPEEVIKDLKEEAAEFEETASVDEKNDLERELYRRRSGRRRYNRG